MIRRISVRDTERVLIFDDDRLRTIAGPGTHYILDVAGNVRVKYYSILEPAFTGPEADVLMNERPLLAGSWFNLVETRDFEMAIVSLGGKHDHVIAPASRVLFWKGAHLMATRIVDVKHATESIAVGR